MTIRNVNVNIDQTRTGITPRNGMMDIVAYLVKKYSRDEGISRKWSKYNNV